MKLSPILVIAACLLTTSLFAAVSKGPLDLSGMTTSETKRYLENLTGKPLKVEGVVKDAGDLKVVPQSMVYEIPAYQRDGSQYVKYGVVCQRYGESTVIFADEGYLSQFVKKNVVDRPVLATGKLVDGKHVAGLPSEMVFVIDSLRLEE